MDGSVLVSANKSLCDVQVRSGSSSREKILGANGLTLELGSFGKFSVRHKPGILRRIPSTGETILTENRRKVRFVCLAACGSKRTLVEPREFSPA